MTDPTPPIPTPADPVPPPRPVAVRPILGSKLLGIIGLIVAIAGLLGDHAGLLPTGWDRDVARVAEIGGILLTALGGSVARPTTRRQRQDDPPTDGP